MEDVLYSVEPYTGNIICHSGVQGMAWGFSKGVANGLRKAIGKLDPATGQYVYDQMKKVGNSYFGQRLKNDQLGSRTMNSIATKAKDTANYIKGRVKSGKLGSRTINNIRTGVSNLGNKIYNTYDVLSGNRKRRQNEAAKQARIKALTDKGIYETSLRGRVNNKAREIKNNINAFKTGASNKINSAKNSINNFIGTKITGNTGKDYIGNALNAIKNNTKLNYSNDEIKKRRNTYSKYQ